MWELWKYTFLLLTIVFSIVTVWNIIGIIKSNNTYRMHMKVLFAIGRYQTEQIKSGKEIEVYIGHMEKFDTTYERWWDWGYQNILPPDKFEIIKPYIVTRREK